MQYTSPISYEVGNVASIILFTIASKISTMHASPMTVKNYKKKEPQYIVSKRKSQYQMYANYNFTWCLSSTYV